MNLKATLFTRPTGAAVQGRRLGEPVAAEHSEHSEQPREAFLRHRDPFTTTILN